MLVPLASFLERHPRILLTTHERPDGDGVGAMLGLHGLLQAMGAETRIVVCPALPSHLAFVDEDHRVEVFDPGGAHRDLAAWPTGWLMVDASEPERLGPLSQVFQAFKGESACLDHHLKGEGGGFHCEFRDAEAAASAQLVYRLLLQRLPRPFPLPMAKALYAGLVDDTGNFRFSNTSPEVLRFAAQLVEDGVEPARIYQGLYHQGRVQKFQLQGRAFANLHRQAEGRYARLTITRADLEACEGEHDDLEGLVNKPLEIRGVEVSCLMEELTDGRVKASFRSRERVNVNAVARALGGGGHFLASGTKVDGPLRVAQAKVDAAVLAQLALDIP